jgi:serine/threonine protein kinase
MSAPADHFGLVGARLDGKYDVVAVVAEGGFGVVYRATHTSLRTNVAVKVLKVPETIEGSARRAFLDRFALEARTIAALDHPAVVRVLDFGASPMPCGEAAPWMVLEWLTGGTLADDLDARRGHGGRSPIECLELLRPAFDALAAAHDEGIVHRDLKPENLMLALNKRGERSMRVLDFGIAKVMGGDERESSGMTATRTQQRAFTVAYAAPEQLSGTRTGPWTDVYALALVLTEMLTDASPYDGEDVAEVFTDALSPRRPTPAKRGYDVGAWEAVLARAVAIKPAERFANAREFLAALEGSVPVVVRAPVIAPPVVAGAVAADTFSVANSERTTKPRRGKVSRATVAGVSMVAVLGLVVGTMSYKFATGRVPVRGEVAEQRAAVPVPTPREVRGSTAAPTASAEPADAAVVAHIAGSDSDGGVESRGSAPTKIAAPPARTTTGMRSSRNSSAPDAGVSMRQAARATRGERPAEMERVPVE